MLKIELPEAFHVGAIVTKLPPSWKNYKHRILHKNEDYSLEEIQKHIRIKEESICRDNLVEGSNEETSKANATSKVPNKNNGKTKKGDTLGPHPKQKKSKVEKVYVLCVANLDTMIRIISIEKT